MSHWWRAHDDSVDNPKLGLLTDRLFRCWYNLNCLASANSGKLPAIGVVAFKLRLPEHKAAEVITALVQANLIDRTEDGFAPHNWNERQFKSDTDATAAERKRRQRARDNGEGGHGNVTRDITAMSRRPEKTETEAETETERKKEDAAPSEAAIDPSAEERDYFVRGKQVCGKDSGGLLTNLLKTRGKKTALARSVVELAATKENPREYVAAAIRGPPAPNTDRPWRPPDV